MKQYKKQLVHQCRKPWQAPYHRWQPHRSGYQCSACGERAHQALTADTIADKLAQQCPQMLLEEEHPEQHSPHRPIQKKLTRAQIIANLLAKQIANQPESQHTLEETKGYLRCAACGLNVHKRTNESAFHSFVQGRCINQLYDQSHPHHSSHTLWQKGDKLNCQNCGTHTQLDAQQRPILTAVLRKPCKGAPIGASPPITEIFRRQTAQVSQSADSQVTSPSEPCQAVVQDTAQIQGGDEPQPNQDLRARPGLADSTSPIVPRHLTYQTDTTALHESSLSTVLRPETTPWAPGHDTQPLAQQWQQAQAPQTPAAKKQRSAETHRDWPETHIDETQEDATSESSHEHDFEVDYF